MVKVTVRLPACIVECISRAYGEPPASAIRDFIVDVLSARLEKVDLPDECEKCLEEGGGVEPA